jgi:phosphinothricin acetyltransferase
VGSVSKHSSRIAKNVVKAVMLVRQVRYWALRITIQGETIMAGIRIRRATPSDLPRLTEIYNYYVVNTPVTFDVEPYTVERREEWFGQFGMRRHRLLLAEEEEKGVVGYAGSTRFRPKAGYDTTVETTVYCGPEAVGRGIGTLLYEALFEALREEDIHRYVAGYALPNPATAALHERFGYKVVGVFSENGRKFGKYWDVCWTERA